MLLQQFTAQGTQAMKAKAYGKAVVYQTYAVTLDDKNKNLLYGLACAYALNGKPEKAIEYLAKAIDNGFSDGNKLTNEPAFADIKERESFQAILKRMKKQ